MDSIRATSMSAANRTVCPLHVTLESSPQTYLLTYSLTNLITNYWDRKATVKPQQ